MLLKHKLVVTALFVAVFFITHSLKMSFYDIASDCIAIVSFALAIYTICIGSLIGSPLLHKLRSTQDYQIKHKTQLGVIKSYISNALIISIITLVLACICKLEINYEFQALILDKLVITQIYYSICFAFFTLNFAFIVLIFNFIISRQLDK